MLVPGMVGFLPTRVHDRSLADFHDAIAGGESGCNGRIHQIDMSPLESMTVDVIRDLT